MKISEMSAEQAEKRRKQNREAKERQKQKQQAQSLNPKQNPLSSPWNQSEPPLSSTSEPTILSAVNAEPADAAPRQLGRNEKKYQQLLDEYLGPASAVIILVLCLFIYRFDMESSEKIADYLAMNQQEQDLIIPPLAAFMDKQNWSAETRDKILQSGDIVGLTLGITSYGSRVLGTLRELKGQVNGASRNATQQAAPAAGGAAGAVSSNGHNVQWGSELANLAQYAA